MVRAPTHVWGDVAGRCSDPLTVSWQAERSVEGGVVDLRVPCRKCVQCLKVRARLWMQRGVREVEKAERTWVIGLTYRDAALADNPAGEITAWLQRLRRLKTGPLRYFVVTEYGSKKGRLHHHALVHCTNNLSWRKLVRCWPNGYTQAELCWSGKRASRYVAKYLTKTQGARLRASKGYGLTRPSDALEPSLGTF